MELAVFLRALYRHPVLLCVGLGVAIACFFLLAFHVTVAPPGLSTRQHVVGTATSRVAISVAGSPSNSLPRPDATAPIGLRTALLAELMASDELRSKVAQTAGIPADQLIVLGPSAVAPPVAHALPVEATAVATAVAAPYAIGVSADGRTPLITFNATSPSVAGAVRLARAAGEALHQRLGAPVDGRATDLDAQQLGVTQARARVVGPRKALAAAAAFLLFGTWCAAIALGASAAAARRRNLARRPAAA